MLKPGERFSFRCHPGISCFNLCCRNLNLYLYPYDIIRLKQNLGITSAEFIDKYTDVVLRSGHAFPDVMLKMAQNNEKTCSFLTGGGCAVYPDRPQTCRTFPLEYGLFFDAEKNRSEQVVFFRPPDFCQGRHESATWTTASWEADQNAAYYNRMTGQWAELLRLFSTGAASGFDPGSEQGRMSFMAAYNMDEFREFILNSSFLKRYLVKSSLRVRLGSDDAALLTLAMAWIRLFIFNISSGEISARKKGGL
ncbi:MAG: YkgJ family cysteine cluster protein [Deltaproteobacteria bacterium]|nr:YkgJ family cysteine cluster protein [Deltaproteobacteria bacterium]